MAWRIKRTLFGIDFEVDVIFRELFGTLFSRRLNKIWKGQEYTDKKGEEQLISETLQHLPKGYFVRFEFDPHKEFFVQFLNEGKNLLMDFPLWKGNALIGKEKKVIRLFRSLGFKRLYRKPTGHSRYPFVYFFTGKRPNKRSLQAYFRDDYQKAAKVTVLIATKIFESQTGIQSFVSDELVEVK